MNGEISKENNDDNVTKNIKKKKRKNIIRIHWKNIFN